MLTTPLLTIAQFAFNSGLTEHCVRNMVARGYLPTRKIGKYRMIDCVALAADAASSSSSYAKQTAGVGEAGRAQRSEHVRASVRAPAARRPDSNHGHNLSAEAQGAEQ